MHFAEIASAACNSSPIKNHTNHMSHKNHTVVLIPIMLLASIVQKRCTGTYVPHCCCTVPYVWLYGLGLGTILCDRYKIAI
jgi:hypothetical protein